MFFLLVFNTRLMSPAIGIMSYSFAPCAMKTLFPVSRISYVNFLVNLYVLGIVNVQIQDNV